MAYFYSSLVWVQLLHKYLQKRGFSYAVLTYNAYLLSALYINIHIVKEGSAVYAGPEAFGEVFRKKHVASGLKILLKADFHAAFSTFRFFKPVHHFQSLFSGLGALGKMLCSPLFHAAYHVFLTSYLSLLILICPELCFSQLSLFFRKGSIVAFI